MKHCPYCNTDYAMAETRCPSCQATDYENKCPKCGKLMEGRECPDCLEGRINESDIAMRVALGEQEYKKNQDILAKLKINPTKNTSCHIGFHNRLGCTCKICGDVSEEDHSYFPISVDGNIERCVICGKTRDVKAESEKAKTYRMLFTIATLMLFPPAGIVLTWLFQEEWNHETKKKISIASGIWFVLAIVMMIFGSSDIFWIWFMFVFILLLVGLVGVVTNSFYIKK